MCGMPSSALPSPQLVRAFEEETSYRRALSHCLLNEYVKLNNILLKTKSAIVKHLFHKVVFVFPSLKIKYCPDSHKSLHVPKCGELELRLKPASGTASILLGSPVLYVDTCQLQKKVRPRMCFAKHHEELADVTHSLYAPQWCFQRLAVRL